MTDLTDLQTILTRLLRHFDAACAAADVSYFLDCGTLLGAVRGGGWIPWDDDIDVLMWREDYEHLRVHLEEHPDPQTCLIDPLHTRGSGIVPRFAICGSRLIEAEAARTGHPERLRVCLDIFVVDEGPARGWLVPGWLRWMQFLQAVRLARGISADRVRVWRPAPQRALLTMARFLCKPIPERLVQRAYLASATMFAGTSGVGYCLNGGVHRRRNRLPRQWFDVGHTVSFEGNTYSCGDPQACLTAMYGPDYLVPPDESDRAGHGLVRATAQLDELDLVLEDRSCAPGMGRKETPDVRGF